MTSNVRGLLVPAVLAIATLLFGWALLRFTVQPGLASFADDSVSYLVMAQVWSPWQEASAAVRDIFPHEAFYPPLFPLLLALFDAGSDPERGHAICALLLAASLPLLYPLAREWLRHRGAAIACTILFALLPGVWLNAKGILSEPLFLVFLLALLLEISARRRVEVLAVLFASLVLTRAIGCVMAVGYIAWALLATAGSLREKLRAAIPALFAIAVYAAWLLLRPAVTSDDYSAFGIDALRQLLHAPGAIVDRIAEQATAAADGWSEALLVYWIQGRSLPHALALALGAVALLGWARRLFLRRPDAAMFAAYLGLLLLWPFPGQMLRFLFPVLPLLLLYAFDAASFVAQRAAGSPLPVFAIAISFAMLSTPALLFLKARADAGQAAGYAAITEWYGSADLEVAKARAQTHLDLFAMLRKVRLHTTESDRVAWVSPGYVALLADRLATPLPLETLAPDQYRQALARNGAKYVLLSIYNPRNTISDSSWQAGIRAMRDEPVVDTTVRADGTVDAALFRLNAD